MQTKSVQRMRWLLAMCIGGLGLGLLGTGCGGGDLDPEDTGEAQEEMVTCAAALVCPIHCDASHSCPGNALWCDLNDHLCHPYPITDP